jgi:hypothetical protein
MAPPPGDLVDAKRLDPRQIQVLPTIGHRHLDRTEDHLPTALEDLGHLLPGKTLRPARQKPGVGPGHRVFPLRPGHLLHPYPAARTLYPSRCIDQEHLHAPKRHELEAPGRQPVVPRAALPTARAHRPAIGPRMQFHFQSRRGGVLHPANRTIHERFEFLDTIEDSLELHPVPLPLGVDGLCTLPSSQRSKRDAPLDRTAWLPFAVLSSHYL